MSDGKPPIILASASRIRRQLLAGAGLRFSVLPAKIDEHALAASLAGRPIEGRAKSLAEAKALDVSADNPHAMVIGADQMLELDGEALFKSADGPAARLMLLRLRGRAHQLHSGVALATNRKVVWSDVSSAKLHVRAFSESWLAHYLTQAGTALTDCVGAYQLEGLGAQIFERIEGDYFTVLGLPMLPLLAQLRQLGVLES